MIFDDFVTTTNILVVATISTINVPCGMLAAATILLNNCINYFQNRSTVVLQLRN